MIEAVIKKHKQSIIQITVSGHAQSAEYGKDLVCAGVSTACIGIANALVHYQFLSQELGTIEINDGYIDIKVQHTNEQIQVVLGTFEVVLETIEESYSKYMKIKKMEV